MIEVRAAPPEHYSWIAERANLKVGPDLRAIEAVDGDRILGMVAYDNWMPNACSMHLAIEVPIASRRLIKPAFGIAFIEFKRQVVIGYVLSNNAKALALDLHLGFKEVGRLRDAWGPGVDMVIMEMRREDCRWLKGARQ